MNGLGKTLLLQGNVTMAAAGETICQAINLANQPAITDLRDFDIRQRRGTT